MLKELRNIVIILTPVVILTVYIGEQVNETTASVAKGMTRNRRLSLSLADAAMGEALRQLEYKADVLVKVGRFYPSSKTCNECGYINQALTLSDRQWVCQGCGSVRDRDWNASQNIEAEGLRLIDR